MGRLSQADGKCKELGGFEGASEMGVRLGLDEVRRVEGWPGVSLVGFLSPS